MISARTVRAAAKQALAVNAKIVPRIVCLKFTTNNNSYRSINYNQ